MKKKQKGWQALVTLLLCVVVIGYIGFQSYRSIFSHVDTELAVMHSVYESIEAEGLVYRTETVIPATVNGHAYYTVENGTRVAKNNAIASVYEDASGGRIKQEIERIDRQIAALKSIQADASTERITLDTLNEQTRDSLQSLVRNTENGTFTEGEDAGFDILTLLSKKQIITGKSVDFSAKIKELENEQKSLKAQYKAPKSTVKAPVAGYFADRTDGFESLLKPEALTNLSVYELEKHLQTQPSVDNSTGGKIVSGYEWYLTCILPDNYYNALGVGKSLSLRMPFVLNESVPATVYACNKDNNGKIAVVFRCDYMSEELATVRKENVEIQLVKHTGLKVPKRAIVIDEYQQAGVYIRSGNVVAFRKIEQLYSEPAEYIVCKEMNDDDYLRMYDDIIVGGKGLYDGKIIN